jgi:hypothetical protein
MKIKCTKSFWIALATGIVMLGCNRPASAQPATDTEALPPAVPAQELPAGSEMLTRGPVHEAFAKPVTTDPQAPLLVTKQPPEPIQEMPPAEKPAGANIVWVPGYWAWDEDRSDFIWVSGCWRNAPPNTFWVPGYWLQLDNGWEWISGFWKPTAAQSQQEIEYLPAPPAAFEVVSVGAPPAPDQIWVPGCWYWSEGRYIQRHGYWIAPQFGWVWVPSHYVWTPRGYIFCQGHWDYDLDNRGVLFTPAYFPAEARVHAGFVFCPGICVDLGMLRMNLFVNPRYNHYCFGDYYDAAYQRAGIYPWYQCQTLHTWYDPIFVYERWQFGRTDPNWARRQAQEFKARQADRDLRPARTYAALQTQWAHLPVAKRPERPLAETTIAYAASQSNPVKFERITAAERQQFAVQSTEVHNFRAQRNGWESPLQQTKPATPLTAQRESRPAPNTSPIPTVRVTSPEREVVSNPTIGPKPSESRYIEKTSPSRPANENYRASTPSNVRSDKDSRGQGPNH